MYYIFYYYIIILGREFLMGFQYVAFLPSRASFSNTFLIIVVEVKASRLHIITVWFCPHGERFCVVLGNWHGLIV